MIGDELNNKNRQKERKQKKFHYANCVCEGYLGQMNIIMHKKKNYIQIQLPDVGRGINS